MKHSIIAYLDLIQSNIPTSTRSLSERFHLSVCLFVCLWYDFLQGPKTDLYETSGHDRGPSK